jgi:hypothetical protein
LVGLYSFDGYRPRNDLDAPVDPAAGVRRVEKLPFTVSDSSQTVGGVPPFAVTIVSYATPIVRLPRVRDAAAARTA